MSPTEASGKPATVVHDTNPLSTSVKKGFEDPTAVMGWEAQYVPPPQFDRSAA